VPRLYTEERVPVEIVCARTADGVLHSGAFLRAAPEGAPAGAAVLWIHGGARNFYYPSYLVLGRALAALGHAFLSANTRGRDVGAVVRWDEARDRPVLGGVAWERFDESPLDLEAWVDRLGALGCPRVVLAGHSMGGWRVAHYQATRRDPRVAGLVLASTPVDPPDPRRRHPPDLLELAERMVAEGRGDALLPPERLGHHQSAATFLRLGEVDLDLYGVASGSPLLARVGCPVLAWFGTAPDEERLGGAASLERAGRALPPGTRLDVGRIEGASHMYIGHEEAVAGHLARWIRALGGPGKPAARPPQAGPPAPGTPGETGA
jgi:pimeloyl-ACP methyl ester carboxylesterase